MTRKADRPAYWTVDGGEAAPHGPHRVSPRLDADERHARLRHEIRMAGLWGHYASGRISGATLETLRSRSLETLSRELDPCD